MNKPDLTYKDAGVDIDAGNELVSRLKPIVKRTQRPEVLAGLGGFGGLFALNTTKYHDPVLVSGTDGVGTKLALAIAMDRHETIGIDLVGMCVNDVIVQGAEPLFFLDYFACGKLDVDRAEAVVSGIARGCELSGCALIGGETAEMPGMYKESDYDLAGFSVGVVNRGDLIDGSAIAAGDAIIGIGSSGPHSNGYSLIRKVLEISGANLDDALSGGTTLADALMAPTRIYVGAIKSLTADHHVHGIVHITGGGLLENIPRVLPESVSAHINLSSWSMPPVFDWLRAAGGIRDEEMLRTFNCGVGMVVIVPASDADACVRILEHSGENAWILGDIKAGNGQVHID